MKVTLKWLLLFVFLYLSSITEQANASPLQKEKQVDIFENPENIFVTSESFIEVLHISDEDEYIMEWTGNSETMDKTDAQQVITFLFEDGYVKDLSSAWSEGENDVSAAKQILSEDSSRYNAISFHYATKAPVFSYDWSETALYVFDTPMTDLHSFKKPKSKEENKSQQVLDTIINQQQDHIIRIIREKAELSEDELLFPLYDVKTWKTIINASDYHFHKTK